MESYEESYLERRPQRLCHMCGRCCRVATTTVSYEKLQELAKQNDKGAVDFLTIFTPYDSIEDARKVDAQIVDNIINRLKGDNNYDEKETTFYYCKYIQPNNLCSKYESRLDLCVHCPSTPWVVVPPGCGFEGWLFWEREEIKRKVRGYKEELLDMMVLRSKTTDEELLKKIAAVEAKLHENIDMYQKYGAHDW